ncbi:hypothetical protein ETAA8_57520 [Anatilimnocola aggregata]|uniref:DUF1579 domain-containing protein n=1 Tax=Anatilimnocola aggregata TaxID=2528021 RepID=A0A517YK74_9BACT|nr:DUF1579 domain-containing protein [Anatilimnocola aggregata]QDU30606.1 hypothetical protein ETAA8_57520 [Anatilimnocola aggregata]
MMNVRNCCVAGMLAVVTVVAAANLAVIAQEKEPKQAAQPDFKLPPGWTLEDLQKCMAAGTPGKMQAHLTKGVGTWNGKTTMWMFPDAPPMKSDCTSNVTSILDGRFIKVEMSGDFPGMGPYQGLGTYGFDNIGQKFVSTWIDNHSTGIMSGEGEISADGKTMTWKYKFNCPLTQKPAVMREVETITGENTKTLESFMTDPKSGKEYRMMLVELTKK